MQRKKRRTRYAMDGFVPRNQPNPARRTSLQTSDKPRKKTISSMDGFTPRQSRASMPLTLSSDDWVDENTLQISDEDSQNIANVARNRRSSVTGDEMKPKFWELGKKRRIKKGKSPLSKRQTIIRRIILVIILIALLVGGFLGYKVLQNATRVFNGNILGLLDSTKLKGEDQGRVNILLAGTSEGDPGHEGARLTDSLMIVSIDTKNNNAFLLSIPRDLWVSYQTKECSAGLQGKINAAYICGEETDFNKAGYAAGGMGLLEKVVQDSFGLNIHYYAKINYAAFKDSVDAVGGINIDLKTKDPRGILDRIFDWQCKYKCYKVKYPNGPLDLNGQQALDLARARGDGIGYPTYGTGNDFGRTERQRQMLVALKDKAISAGVLSNPTKIASLLDAAGNNVETDFQTNELRRLYEIGKNVKSDNIKSIGLTDDDVSLVETFRSNDGQSAVRPVAGTRNFSEIISFIRKIISSDPVVKEGASVTVLNGSGVTGLAQEKADQIAVKGILVTDVGNAASRNKTLIIDQSDGKKSGTKAFLQKQFSAAVGTDSAATSEAAKYKSDFVIILGKNSQTSN